MVACFSRNFVTASSILIKAGDLIPARGTPQVPFLLEEVMSWPLLEGYDVAKSPMQERDLRVDG